MNIITESYRRPSSFNHESRDLRYKSHLKDGNTYLLAPF